MFLKKFICVAVAGTVLAACSSQGASTMPPVSSASLPHAQSVNVAVPNVAQAPSGNGANVPEAASGQAPTTRHQAHSMFVEAPPTCANGWTEDPFGNCIPPTGGGGGVIGPVCPYNCGGTGGSGGSGGCITNPNALGCGGGPIACVGTATTCQNIPCSGSPETIGDFFRDPGSNDTIEVKDINSIWQSGAEVGSQVPKVL